MYDISTDSLKALMNGKYKIQCIHFLRQWLNEDRPIEGRLITTTELENWLLPLIKASEAGVMLYQDLVGGDVDELPMRVKSAIRIYEKNVGGDVSLTSYPHTPPT